MTPVRFALLALLALFHAGAHAQLVTAPDLQAFTLLHPDATVIGFDELAPAAHLPVLANGVAIASAPGGNVAEVLDLLLIYPHDFWFSGRASPPNFVLVNGPGIDVWLPAPAIAAGLVVQCFACDLPAQPSTLRFELLDGHDQVVAQADERIVMTYPGAHFIAVESAQPFQRLRITRYQAQGWNNYMIDDLRIAYAPPGHSCAASSTPACVCNGRNQGSRRCQQLER